MILPLLLRRLRVNCLPLDNSTAFRGFERAVQFDAVLFGIGNYDKAIDLGHLATLAAFYFVNEHVTLGPHRTVLQALPFSDHLGNYERRDGNDGYEK